VMTKWARSDGEFGVTDHFFLVVHIRLRFLFILLNK
jgi:hypothetical protein